MDTDWSRKTGSDTANTERRRREEELRAEMEFAPRNEADVAKTGLIPPEKVIYNELPASEFFEMPESEAPASKDARPAVAAASVAAVSAAAAKAAAPEEQVRIYKPERHTDSLHAMKTASVPREPVDDMEHTINREEPEEEDEEEDDEAVDAGKPVRIALLVAYVIVAAAIILLLLLSRRWQDNARSAAPDSSSEEESSEEESYSNASLFGIITQLDLDKDIIRIYSADQQEEMEFNLANAGQIMDAAGTQVTAETLAVGDLVEVSYLHGATDKLQRLRISAGATIMKDVIGAETDAGRQTIKVQKKTYHYDDHLICQYKGEDLDPAEITGQYVLNMTVVDNHIYMIRVTHSIGTVTITNAEELEGMIISFIPQVGSPVETEIKPDMMPIVLTEGFNRYEVRKDDQVVGSGTVFVVASIRKELEIRLEEEKTGQVVLQITPDDGARVTIDGEEQTERSFTLTYGEHTLLIESDGFESIEEVLNIQQPYSVFEYKLKATQFRVSVSASMTGTDLYSNGEYIGTYNGNALRFTVPVGTYSLALIHPGYEVLMYTLRIDNNSSPVIDLYFSKFVPVEQSSAPESSEEISSKPESSAEESSEEESSVEESSAEESSIEESSAEESSAPEESSLEESSAEESSAPEESSEQEASEQESSEPESVPEDISAPEVPGEVNSPEDAPDEVGGSGPAAGEDSSAEG